MKTHSIILAILLSTTPSLLATELILGATDNKTIDFATNTSYDKIELSGGDFLKQGTGHLSTPSFSLAAGASITVETGTIQRLDNPTTKESFGGCVATGTAMLTNAGAPLPWNTYLARTGMKISATGSGATFDGQGNTSLAQTEIGGSQGGSLSHATFVNSAQLRVGSNQDDAFVFNNVTFDLTTYSNRVSYDFSDKTNYTIDLSQALTAAYMQQGTWDTSAHNIAKWDGNLIIQLDNESFNNILDNAMQLTLTVGNAWGGNYIVSGIDGSDLTINIINKTTGQSFGNFNGEGDGTSLNFTWSQNAIPEPSTTTLSLLALAGLAARRRRV